MLWRVLTRVEEQLPAVIDGDPVWPVRCQRFIESLDEQVHRSLRVGRGEFAGSIPNQRAGSSTGVAIRVVLVQPFRSKTSLVDGMPNSAAYPHDLPTADADVDAAPNRTEATRRRYSAFHPTLFVLLGKCRGSMVGNHPRRLMVGLTV